MEFMDSFPLNLAHQLERRAESFLQQKLFDESIQCYQRAVEKLKEAEERSTNQIFLQSLKYQQERCIQLQNIIRMKKNQYVTNKAQKQDMFQALKMEQAAAERNTETRNLQHKIYRAMEEADSLLEQLERRGKETDGEDSESVKSDVALGACGGERPVQVEAVEPLKLEGSKWPKDDRTVIEELRTLNHQLRSLIIQLVTQLDSSLKEVESLRERLHFLESERRAKSDEAESRVVATARKSSLHVITDSTGGSSPFVYSPCSELSPDVPVDTTHLVTRELPVLAPLEMPNFDFDVFKKRGSTEHSPIS